ncbi:MAG TPA: hypothetical protein VHO69_18950, partial [Phototrophicaceae bacterium]|nr:hypothetical protein [Phototrophicaceae bacterium]
MNESPVQKKILLALPDSWQTELQHFLSSKGLQVVPAATFEAALKIVQNQNLQGMIIVTDWLISGL